MTQSTLVEQETMRQRAHQIFDMVKGFARGADEVEITLATNIGEYLRFGHNELGQSQHSKSRDLSVRVTTDRRQGRASTGRLEKSLIEKTVQKALAQAKAAPEDPDYLPMLGPQQYRSVERYHEATVDAPADVKAGHVIFAIDLAKKNSLLASGVLGTSADHGSILNSSGLEAHHRATTGHFSLTMDADNGNQTGFALSTFADIREQIADLQFRVRVHALQNHLTRTASVRSENRSIESRGRCHHIRRRLKLSPEIPPGFDPAPIHALQVDVRHRAEQPLLQIAAKPVADRRRDNQRRHPGRNPEHRDRRDDGDHRHLALGPQVPQRHKGFKAHALRSIHRHDRPDSLILF